MQKHKVITLIVDGKHISNINVTKNNKIKSIKEFLNNYEGKKTFYLNSDNEILRVFDGDTYDNLTLGSICIWNKMVNPTIKIDTRSMYPLGNQEYLRQFSFTGNMDVDRAILEKLSDKDILMACSVNKFMYTKVCNQKFFQRLILKRFPTFIENTTAILPFNKEIPPYKNWRDKYLNIVRYIDSLKRDFNYDFREGDPRVQYLFLKEQPNIEKVNVYSLTVFVPSDEPELIKYVIDKEDGMQANRLYTHLSFVLRYSIQRGTFNIANYLVKQGVKLTSLEHEFLFKQIQESKKDDIGDLHLIDKKIEFLNNL